MVHGSKLRASLGFWRPTYCNRDREGILSTPVISVALFHHLSPNFRDCASERGFGRSICSVVPRSIWYCKFSNILTICPGMTVCKCMSVCLCVRLSVRPSVCLSPFVCMHACNVFVYENMQTYFNVQACTYVLVRLYLYVYMPVCIKGQGSTTKTGWTNPP